MRLLLLLLMLLCRPALAQSDFALEEGGQQHFFLLRGGVRAHLLNRPGDRLVIAFPAENSGLSLWFEPGCSAVVVAPPRADGQDVVARLRIRGRLRVREALLGSIRSIRDRQTDGPRASAREREARRRLVPQGDPGWFTEQRVEQPGWLEFRRRRRDGKEYRISLRRLRSGEVELRGHCPYANLPAYAVGDLFREEALQLARAHREDSRLLEAMRGLQFLATRSKLMAGSWRFLTYFGRDTLLSAMLLEPAIQPQVYRDALASVVRRLAPNGEVAHEEDLGDWAEMRHLLARDRSLYAPLYDYKMVDDDFLLPIALARDSSSAGLLADPGVQRNLSFVRQAARDFVGLKPGQEVGDWRDSREGLAFGRYPVSVNAHLVPAALEALRRLEPQRDPGPLLAAARERAEKFWVRLPAAEVNQRVQQFLAQLPAAERDWLRPRLRPVERDLRFRALSLDEHLQPIAVMNSDDSFSLFLSDPPLDELDSFLDLLELPYPQGLMTEVGPVVANPALSQRPDLMRTLGRGAYHGAVVWSWQSAMLTCGLLRQLPRCEGARAERVRAAIVRLREAERRAGRLAGSELWSIAPAPDGWKAVAFGSGTATSRDESNPVQLWSTVYPAVLMRLRKAGFASL